MSHPPTDDLPHRAARLARHEVGDLLQSVYSTVEVLFDRLPDDADLERLLLGRLKHRAELCRHELEALVVLSCPGEAAAEAVGLGPAFADAVERLRRRHPDLTLDADAPPPDDVRADGGALASVAFLLLAAACQAASRRVALRFSRSERHVDCLVQRDGGPPSAEELAWLAAPFATTHGAVLGLGLALARRAVPGGDVSVLDGGDGPAVRVRFPLA